MSEKILQFKGRKTFTFESDINTFYKSVNPIYEKEYKILDKSGEKLLDNNDPLFSYGILNIDLLINLLNEQRKTFNAVTVECDRYDTSLCFFKLEEVDKNSFSEKIKEKDIKQLKDIIDNAEREIKNKENAIKECQKKLAELEKQ